MKSVYNFNRDNWFEIGNIISNEFIDAHKTFSVERKDGLHFLNTQRCDRCPLIRIYNDLNSISKIQVNGDYTDGWQDIQDATMQKINTYLNSLS